MRIENTAFKVESNTNNETVNFGISNVNKVIELLVSQYKTPLTTIPQEYISNAVDATKEANSLEKVIVNVPTIFNDGFLQIRDYGMGLTEQRLKTIFVNFGASTKSNSNNQIGGFGIGAKSAFKYTDHFYITTFLNNVKSDYVVRIGDQGGLVLEYLSKEETQEKNGTLIKIKIKNNDFKDIIKGCHRIACFMPDMVKVNDGDAYKLGERFKISDNVDLYNKYNLPMFDPHSLTALNLVVGGVTYHVSNSDIHKYNIKLPVKSTYCLFVRLDIGDIMPIQTRESIDTQAKTTINTLNRLSIELPNVIDNYLKEQLSVKNVLGKIKAIQNVNGLAFNSNHIKDVEFLSLKSLYSVDFNKNIVVKRYTRKSKVYNQTLKSYRTQYENRINFDELDRIYVKDVNESDVDTRRRIKNALGSKNDIILISSIPGLETKFKKVVKWFSPKLISSLELPEKVLKAKGGVRIVPRTEITLSHSSKARKTIYSDNVVDTIFYTEYNNRSEFDRKLEKINNVTVWEISKTNIKKIKDNPKFIRSDESIKLNFSDSILNNIAESILREHYCNGSSHSSRLEKLATDKIYERLNSVPRYFAIGYNYYNDLDKSDRSKVNRIVKSLYKKIKTVREVNKINSVKEFKQVYLTYYKGL